MTTRAARASKALVLAAVIASLPMTASSAFANCVTGNCWGAVAYGPKNKWAWVVNYRERDTAKQLALAKCKDGCTRVLTFKNTCGAYVTGDGGHGWGTSRNKKAAVGEAMMQCASVAKNCTLRVWACTER